MIFSLRTKRRRVVLLTGDDVDVLDGDGEGSVVQLMSADLTPVSVEDVEYEEEEGLDFGFRSGKRLK